MHGSPTMSISSISSIPTPGIQKAPREGPRALPWVHIVNRAPAAIDFSLSILTLMALLISSFSCHQTLQLSVVPLPPVLMRKLRKDPAPPRLGTSLHSKGDHPPVCWVCSLLTASGWLPQPFSPDSCSPPGPSLPVSKAGGLSLLQNAWDQNICIDFTITSAFGKFQIWGLSISDFGFSDQGCSTCTVPK